MGGGGRGTKCTNKGSYMPVAYIGFFFFFFWEGEKGAYTGGERRKDICINVWYV